MPRLLAASLLALSLALACGSSPDGSADLGPEMAADALLEDATEVDVGIDADADAHADVDRESVDDVCDLACPDWQHCERADAGMACVDNVCEPSCAIGTRCEAGECRPYCDKVCDELTHCKWTTGDDPFMTCTNLCEPACPVEQHCEQGACVANVCSGDLTTDACEAVGCVCLINGSCGACMCDPPCANGYCTLVEGAPVCVDECGCPEGSHCSVGNTCAPNVCDPACGLGDLCQVDGGSAPLDCAPRVCTPACTTVEYCDGQDTCQPLPCELTCTEAELGDVPVCGTDCIDYGNPCAARCAGVDVQYPHLCPFGCGCGDCANDPCPDPVCGNDGQTYESICILDQCHPGVGLAYPGFCVGSSCPCDVTPNPVCGTLPGQEGWATIPNGCTAACLDATVWFGWACGCCDPRPEAPVCAYNPLWDQWYQERNQCVVDSYGYASSSYPGPCVCCDAPGSIGGCCDLNVGPPVCSVDGVTYANLCALTCADVAKQNDGACACSAEWEPVCGQSVLEPGKTYTYGNACVAQSVYGVTSTTPGACELCTVACSVDGLDEVCGLDGVSYPNPCYLLKCNGDAVTKGLADARCYGACESCP